MDTTTVYFAHDCTSVYYPAAPGRVYTIPFAALARAREDADLDAATEIGDLWDLLMTTVGPDAVDAPRLLAPLAPGGRSVPAAFVGTDGATLPREELDAALARWAAWCDRDARAACPGA